MDAGLVDLVWQVMWADNDATPDEELEDRIGEAQGYVVFMHGWTGNHAIWESLPGMVVTGNRAVWSPSRSITTASATSPFVETRPRSKPAIRPPPCA